MPDISICSNDSCKLSNSCWRFNCEPNKHYQRYEPNINTKSGKLECESFIAFPICKKSNNGMTNNENL